MMRETAGATTQRPPMPQNEDFRLEVLRSYRILDTRPEQAFDRIAHLAAVRFDVPIALVTLVDSKRQWFKSCVGLDIRGTGRDEAFCAHAIAADETMVVPDATLDPRFANNPLVTGDPFIRFYAGAPLKAKEGAALGTLCIIDTKPRPVLSPQERAELETMAAIAVDLMEMRTAALQLNAEGARRDLAEKELKRQRDLKELLQVIAVAANQAASIETAGRVAVEQICRRLNWPVGNLLVAEEDRLVPTDVRHISDDNRFSALDRASSSSTFERGEGLPGRVLEQGSYVFIGGPGAQEDFPRAEAARSAGIRAALGFPILIDDEVVGALEFFCVEPDEPDEEIVDAMVHVGTQLGRVVERARATAGAAAREQLALGRAEAASRLAAIVESSRDAIFGKSLEGKIISWNSAAEAMYGYPASEIVGRSVQVLVPPDRKHEVPKILARVRSGEAVQQHETERVAKDGRTLQVSISVSPVKGPSGEIIGAATIARDITSQKQMEATLRDNAERTRSILETASDAFVALDSTGVISEWNRRAEEMFGWSHDEAVGRRLEDTIIPERYRERHVAGLERFFATGEGPILDRRIEIEALCRDGTEFLVELAVWALRSDGDCSFNAFIADISERKKAEEEIQASEAFKSAILAGIAEGVIVTDDSDRIVMVNPAMERLGGWSIDEVAGRPLTDVYRAVDQRGEPITPNHPRIGELFIERDGTITSRGYGVFLVSRAGAEIPVALTLAPIRDGAGVPVGRVAVVRDVSQEQEVDQLKSSLVSTVSHELRTPLTMIQGFSELLMARDMERDKELSALEQIHSSAERLARLIDDLLSVSRIESGSLAPVIEQVDPRSLVEQVTAAFTSSGRDVIIELAEDDLPAVAVDEDMTVQILTNLVSNAIKYSPDDARVHVRGRRVGDEVEISVTDEGLGMTQEQLEKLFQKFFRADSSDVRKTPGTGLGLYITKSLVDLQGGRIWATSEPGRGSTFSFTSPVDSEGRATRREVVS